MNHNLWLNITYIPMVLVTHGYTKCFHHVLISIGWFQGKIQETPMILMGESMVSGEDFPFFLSTH